MLGPGSVSRQSAMAGYSGRTQAASSGGGVGAISNYAITKAFIFKGRICIIYV